jgi:hypothetical protein
VQDEEQEAERSGELQEGRLRNRGQSDLRWATIAMSQAEKHLTAGATAEALVAERAAVAALQRAFSKDRYILRALAARDELDSRRRLTGDLSRASSWQRHPPLTEEDRHAAQLQDLLRGIADLATEVSAGRSAARSRAAVLAEQALRIDPAARALRDAALSLQRAADDWAGGRAAEGQRELDAASRNVAEQAARAFAAAPYPVGVASPLDGALADALSKAGRR